MFTSFRKLLALELPNTSIQSFLIFDLQKNGYSEGRPPIFYGYRYLLDKTAQIFVINFLIPALVVEIRIDFYQKRSLGSPFFVKSPQS